MTLPKDQFGCPFLLLAPMEGLGDICFRRAMVSIGGFDESCIEFMRVPLNAHVQSLARVYVATHTAPIPQAAQLMGSDPSLMAAMAHEVSLRGAPRIDLNCGCPSNTVTGKGAGSSLLKQPEHLHKIAKAMVGAVKVPVTAKLRIGFDDPNLFKENILAAQESGIKFLTLHARTKADGYVAPARWEYITEAKQMLKIPVIGNGDINTVEDAIKMLEITKCDGLMIGRGSVTNPFIFQEIRAHFAGKPFVRSWSLMKRFIEVFAENFHDKMPERNKINKLKQLISYLFKGSDYLLERKHALMRTPFTDAKVFQEAILSVLESSGLYSKQ